MAMQGISGMLDMLGLGDIGAMVGLSPNPGLEDMGAALQQAQQDYAAYRPEMWAARMGALDKTMSLFQPVSDQLGRMYGQEATLPLDAAFSYNYQTPSPATAAAQSQQPQGMQPKKRGATAQPGGFAGSVLKGVK